MKDAASSGWQLLSRLINRFVPAQTVGPYGPNYAKTLKGLSMKDEVFHHCGRVAVGWVWVSAD